MIRARRAHLEAESLSKDRNEGFFSRRSWRKEAEVLGEEREVAEARVEKLVKRESTALDQERKGLRATKAELEAGVGRRDEWLGEHPEVGLRLEAIGKEMTDLGLRRQLDPALDEALGLDHLGQHPRPRASQARSGARPGPRPLAQTTVPNGRDGAVPWSLKARKNGVLATLLPPRADTPHHHARGDLLQS